MEPWCFPVFVCHKVAPCCVLKNEIVKDYYKIDENMPARLRSIRIVSTLVFVGSNLVFTAKALPFPHSELQLPSFPVTVAALCFPVVAAAVWWLFRAFENCFVKFVQYINHNKSKYKDHRKQVSKFGEKNS